MVDLFQEVQEDVKREQYLKLWKRYGTFVIGIAVIIVLAVAGWQFWQRYERAQRAEAGEQLVAANDLAQTGQREQAIAAFAELADARDGGYETLARLREAALKAEAGDRQGAAEIYASVAADGDADRPYRDLATVAGALLEIDSADPEALKARLQPLTAEDNPWRYSALEATALLAMRQNDVAAARDIYTRLVDDQNAPPGLRQRAQEMLGALGPA